LSCLPRAAGSRYLPVVKRCGGKAMLRAALPVGSVLVVLPSLPGPGGGIIADSRAGFRQPWLGCLRRQGHLP
jgi:hypothetical protein